MTDNTKSWEQIETSTVYANKHWSVRADKVRRPDGSISEHDVIDSPDAVNIVAMTKAQEVYVIGQFRYTTGVFSWEIPGGSTDGEEPLQAAKRELQEETGLQADQWKFLGKYQTANGSLSEHTHIYLATGLTQTSNNEQAEEGITQMKTVALNEILRMIRNGEITHAQTIVSITKAALELGLIA